MKHLKVYIAILIAALAFTATATLSAQERRKVGVVLSGGGAKGVAHISVLKVIEEAGIPIDYITGTSMGAIIGGLYAAGYDVQTLDSMVRSQNWRDLLSDRVSRRNVPIAVRERHERYILSVGLDRDKRFVMPSGLVGGNNVLNLLTELTTDYHDSISFNDLPIPFSCVAYDLVSGKTVVLDKGYLPKAIRASMSIPGAFEPVRMDGMILIDGGISNNFPADVVRDMGADIIIGADVGAGMRNSDEIRTLADMFNQITYFTGEENYDSNREIVDLLIHPDIVPYNAGSFTADAIDTLLVRGEAAARAKWDDLIALKEKIGIPADYVYNRFGTIELGKEIELKHILFEGLELHKDNDIQRIIGLPDYSRVTSAHIHDAVSKIQGTGLFTDITYRLEGSSPPYNLIFSVNEKSKNSVGLGLRFDTEEMAAILLDMTLASKRLRSTFQLTGCLSENPYARTAWSFGNEFSRKLSVSYMFKYNNLSQYQRGDKLSNVDFGYHLADLSYSNIRVRDFKLKVGLKYEYFDYHSLLLAGEWEQHVRSEGLFSYYALAQFDSFDRLYHPTRGHSVDFECTLYTSNMITYHGNSPFSAIRLNYRTALSASRRVTFLPGLFGRVLMGKGFSYSTRNLMGGTVAGRYMPQQLPFVGINHFEQFDDAVVGASLDLRVRLWRRHFVSLKSNFARHNNDLLEIFNEGTNLFGYGLSYSTNTIAGPIEAQIDYSARSKKVGLYFSLGHYF